MEIAYSFSGKKLRNLDCVGARGGGISGEAFFVHDRLLECWYDLIDKDLRILPIEGYTDNGPVTEFHLVYVINIVDGLDKDLGPIEFPKATNDFMNGAQIAREITWKSTILGNFYIIPELVEKTLKRLHKKRLRDVYIMTFKEYHEWLRGC